MIERTLRRQGIKAVDSKTDIVVEIPANGTVTIDGVPVADIEHLTELLAKQ